MIRVHAFRQVPPFAQGLVRDLRVRWALEEAGLSYETDLLDPGENKSPGYRQLQPFGQVPVYRDGDIELFESGAIVVCIAEKSEALMPRDEPGRLAALTWIFAALNTIEPAIQGLAEIDLFNADQAWAIERRPAMVERVRMRLGELSDRLGDRDYLTGRFTAGDLMMVSVLRILRHTDLVAEFPNLTAYQTRCEARPAFQRALAAQMEPFQAQPPLVAA
jgi:glutathione S-transferase